MKESLVKRSVFLTAFFMIAVMLTILAGTAAINYATAETGSEENFSAEFLALSSDYGVDWESSPYGKNGYVIIGGTATSGTDSKIYSNLYTKSGSGYGTTDLMQVTGWANNDNNAYLKVANNYLNPADELNLKINKWAFSARAWRKHTAANAASLYAPGTTVNTMPRLDGWDTALQESAIAISKTDASDLYVTLYVYSSSSSVAVSAANSVDLFVYKGAQLKKNPAARTATAQQAMLHYSALTQIEKTTITSSGYVTFKLEGEGEFQILAARSPDASAATTAFLPFINAFFLDNTDPNNAPTVETGIEFLNEEYSVLKNQSFNAEARIYKSGVPYAGAEITFMLEGDNIYSQAGVNTYLNMNDVFGSTVSDANGYVSVTSCVPYVGEYRLVASIEPQLNEEDAFYGLGTLRTVVPLTVNPTENPNLSTPFLMSISDAVKPGNAVTLSGYNLQDDGDLEIAYRANEGTVPAGFDEQKVYSYIGQNDILFVDDVNGTGIMFNFPKSESAGIYDFYVHNSSGWGNGITMNATRPLYLDQEGAFEGQEIQIVGRNFLQNEYGVGNLQTALSTLKVKLTQITDSNGNAVSGVNYILTQANGGILTGNKVEKEEALQFENDKLEAEDIPYTYSLRVTIQIPAINNYGKYEITVASDGQDFRQLIDNCKLDIYEKKAQNWNTTVFGSYGDNHVGNDPLDLGVYWAQDLNYTNVITMTPNNTFASAASYTADLNSKIITLNRQGGGVVYFPEGTYYLYNEVALKAGVMLVGEGEDKTVFEYANNTQTNTIWFRGDKNQINSGIARVSLLATDERLCNDDGLWYAPKYIFNWSGAGGATEQDTTITTTKNRFLTNINATVYVGDTIDPSKCNRSIVIGGKNVIIKNSAFEGALIYSELNAYGTLWNVKMVYTGAIESSIHWMGRYCFIENSYFDMQGMGHGPSIKSDQYVAYSYVTNAGNRAEPTNDGESLLMEAPSGAFSTGMVLESTNRSVTLDFTGGIKILEDTAIRFNQCAVYISEGAGQGQYRYIKTAGTGDYLNIYELMDWEKDWDVLPDHTSVFACIAPLANLTVYHYKAYDCVSTVCVYSNFFDAVIDGCTLVDTGGISGGGLASGGMGGGRINPCLNVRIINNDISGVGTHTNNGISSASVGQGGGIYFYSGGSGDYMGLLTLGLTIRDNYLHDLIPDVMPSNGISLDTGITIMFRGGQNNNANGMRYTIIENNIIENSLTGLRIERTMTGVVLKNNHVSGTTMLSDDVTVDEPIGFYASAIHLLYIDGELSALSGEYKYEALLPLPIAPEGKVFLGWTQDAVVTQNSVIVNKALIKNTTLYAVFGDV